MVCLVHLRPIGLKKINMQKGETTRELIITTSAELFNTKGYNGSSMSDIMEATGLKKGGIYIKELINILIFVNQNQLNKKDSNFALFNATLFPCPTLENYAKEISNIFNYTGSFFTIPKFMINILLFISLCFTRIFKQNNSFSYYRLIKLFRSNNIVPKYLIKKNYVFTYNLNKSFNNWKKINPTDW